MAWLSRFVACVAVVFLLPVSVPADVRTSKHNLSSTGPGPTKSSTSTDVCGYCHSAHTSLPTVPLWNRTVPNPAAYVIYTSAPLTTAARAASIAVDSPSLACLSCHDGTTGLAAGVVHSYSNMTVDSGNVVADKLVGPANLGNNLSNDHPIGFSYVQAQTEKPTRLNVLNLAVTPLKLYNVGGRIDQMECGTCHAVHDNANPPFLRITRSGSAICIACHNM